MTVGVRRNLCLTSSNLKCRLLLTTKEVRLPAGIVVQASQPARPETDKDVCSTRKARCLYYNPGGEAKRPRAQRVLVTAVRQLLLHLVLFLFPRPNQNRTIVFPDIGIVEARF